MTQIKRIDGVNKNNRIRMPKTNQNKIKNLKNLKQTLFDYK